MADQSVTGEMVSNGRSLQEKAVDAGDGTFMRKVATVAVTAGGSPAPANPNGRADQSASAPVAIDNAALAGVNQTYTRAAAVSAAPGNAVLVTGVTTAGTVTLGLSGGGSVILNVPLGSSIWPIAAVTAALTTAVGGTFQSLFFT